MKKNQNGFSAVEGLLIVIIVLLVGFIGYYVYHAQNNTNSLYDSSDKTSSSSATKSADKGVSLSRGYLPFTLSYPSNWEIRNESTTDYGFDSIELQAKGSVVETGHGEDLKSGALMNITRTSDKSTNPENSIDEYTAKSRDVKYLKNSNTITLDGTKALEYDLGATNDGGTSLHELRFYKDNILYVFSMDNTQYSQSQYKAAFQSTVHSIKFK
jgi:Tfp pilus assembly protein PilV